jgi:hypothetical protein
MQLWGREILQALLYPHNRRVLLQLSKKHLFREQPYTCTTQPGCKTRRRVTRRQLVAAQYAELLDRNDAIIVHRNEMRLVLREPLLHSV